MPDVKKAPAQASGIIDRFLLHHPVSMAMRVVLASISVLFLTLMVLFALYDPGQQLGGQPFPKWFFLSTGLILVSSFTVDLARRAFLRDDGDKLFNYLLVTLVLAVAFSITQVFGWRQLWQTQLTLYSVPDAAGATQSTPGAAFLYIISGLHLLHLIGGLVFLFLSIFRVVNRRSDLVKSMLFYSDPLEKARIGSLALYWHFLDLLWVVLFLYFLWFFV